MTPTPRTVRFATLIGPLLFAVQAMAQTGPAHVPVAIPPGEIGMACAPTVVWGAPEMTLRVTGGQGTMNRRIYAQGDLITINAGMGTVDVGQEFFVRRPVLDRGQRMSPTRPTTIRTVGWVRVYAVEEAMSLVTVTHGCDTVEVGDYLESFALPQVPATSEVRSKPERDNYGQVLMGNDRRTSFGTRDYVVINQGSADGITPGMNLVFYRNTNRPENFLFDLGEAVVVDVQDTTATVLVTVSRDAIGTGDLVAMRK